MIRSIIGLAFLLILYAGTITGSVITPACGQPTEVDATDSGSMKHIGKLYDRLRAAQVREQPSLDEEITDIYSQYVKAKNEVQKAASLQYSLDVSATYQWGFPEAGSPAGELLFSTSINWDFLKNTSLGSGSLQFAYNIPWYMTSRNALELQNKLKLITPTNDFPTNMPAFNQLTVTYVPPRNWVSVVVGQFPISNFDTNQYANNQQINFISYPLAQNGSSTYPSASLGIYTQVSPTNEISFAAGFQDANNITGKTIQFSSFGDGQYTWFVYTQWNPQFKRLGSSQFSFLYYRSPSVPEQASTSGWSFNGVQNLNDNWGLFLRANGADGYTTPIKTSIAGGGVLNNPLNRDKLGQIGLGIAWDQAAKPPANPSSARDEWVMEAYWAWTFVKGFQITPDVQLYVHPALNPGQSNVWVFSLRSSILF
jgi:porin